MARFRKKLTTADKDRYRADPKSYIREHLMQTLWSAQDAVVDAVVAHRRTMVVACHGVGKSRHSMSLRPASCN